MVMFPFLCVCMIQEEVRQPLEISAGVRRGSCCRNRTERLLFFLNESFNPECQHNRIF